MYRKGKRDIRKDNIGFLAQDVQKVFPELIAESDSSGLLGINYIGLIPVLVDALNEQQTKITTQQKSNNELKKQVDELAAQVSDLKVQVNTCCGTVNGKGNLKTGAESEFCTDAVEQKITTSTSVLEQNAPNPFNQTSIVRMNIPAIVLKAQIAIYDLSGKQLKAYPINGRGATSLSISAGEFPTGMYKYALLTDGQLVDTKTMVITE